MGYLVLPGSVFAPIPVVEAQTIPSVTQAPAAATIVTTKSASAPLTVKLTAYNALPAQTDNNPFTTASGAFSNPEVVAARSVDLASKLPFGTVIEVSRSGADTPSCNYKLVESQIGYRVIADSMNTRITNTVDILMDETKTVTLGNRQLNPGIALGLCGNVSVRVVGHIKVSEIPDTQAQLAAMIQPQVLAQR